jgi:predicted transposase/invertase (TIGR01784 family)
MAKAVRWCIAHNILKPFLETNGSEVVNMLFDEWKLEDALVVEREEGREEGLEEGLEKGEERKQREVAQNALAEGLPVEIIQKITGLDSEAIRQLGL